MLEDAIDRAADVALESGGGARLPDARLERVGAGGVPAGACGGCRGHRVRGAGRAVQRPALHGRAPGARASGRPGDWDGGGAPRRCTGAGRRARRDHHPDHRAARAGLRRPGRGGGVRTTCLREAAALGAEMRELQRVSPAWWGLAETALLARRVGRRGGLVRAGVRGLGAGPGRGVSVSVRGDRHARLPRPARPTGARDWLARASELLLERGIPGTLGAIDHAAGLIHLHEGQTGKARICAGPGGGVLVGAAALLGGYGRAGRPGAMCARAPGGRPMRRCCRPGRGRLASVGAHAPAAVRVPAVGELAGVALGPWRPVRPPLARAPRLARSRPRPVGRLARSAAPDSARRARSTAGWSALRSGAGGRPAVATGATNREIAAALTIAPKTVAAHVEHILAKLGVSRRAQIAAWVATHG